MHSRENSSRKLNGDILKCCHVCQNQDDRLKSAPRSSHQSAFIFSLEKELCLNFATVRANWINRIDFVCSHFTSESISQRRFQIRKAGFRKEKTNFRERVLRVGRDSSVFNDPIEMCMRIGLWLRSRCCSAKCRLIFPVLDTGVRSLKCKSTRLSGCPPTHRDGSAGLAEFFAELGHLTRSIDSSSLVRQLCASPKFMLSTTSGNFSRKKYFKKDENVSSLNSANQEQTSLLLQAQIFFVWWNIPQRSSEKSAHHSPRCREIIQMNTRFCFTVYESVRSLHSEISAFR